MTRNFRKSVLVLLVITGSFSTVGAEGDHTVLICEGCHGGQKPDIPVIRGISALVLENSLMSYLDGSRIASSYQGTDMKTIAQNMPEQALKNVLEYYSAQSFTPIKQPFDAEMAEKGMKLHEMYCERCHSEGGSVAEDDSSILAGQWKGYLVKEMRQYKNATRAGDKRMLEVFQLLDDSQLKALAEFYASHQ